MVLILFSLFRYMLVNIRLNCLFVCSNFSVVLAVFIVVIL